MGGYVKISRIDSDITRKLCPLVTNPTYIDSSNGMYQVGNIREFNNADDFVKHKRSTCYIVPMHDTSERTDFSKYFNGYAIGTFPSIDTGNGVDFSYMCNGCRQLRVIPHINTSKGENFSYMCKQAYHLYRFPELDLSNGKLFTEMFYGCYWITSLPTLNLSKAEDCTNIFYDCFSLVSIEKIICSSLKTSALKGAFDMRTRQDTFESIHYTALEHITIEGTIKVDSNDLNLSKCNKLTVDSLMSFINAFEDNTGEETQYTVTIGATNLAKLSAEQIAVATNKNILLV